MSPPDFLLLILPIFLAVFVSIGWGMIALNRADFRIPKFCSWGSAVCLFGIGVLFGFEDESMPLVRYAIVGTLGAVVSIGLVISLRWIAQRETETLEVEGEAMTISDHSIEISGSGNIVTQNQSGGTNVINQAMPPRRLTQQQMDTLEASARQFSGRLPTVYITALSGSQESQRFALDFVTALKRGGIQTDLSLPIPGLKPDVVGIRVVVRGTSFASIEEVPLEGRILAKIVDSTGLSFNINPMAEGAFGGESVVLAIGDRPEN